LAAFSVKLFILFASARAFVQRFATRQPQDFFV
jgi:hypothetical protein